MNTLAHKTRPSQSSAATNPASQKKTNPDAFVDNRREAAVQRRMQEMADNSPRHKSASQLQAMAGKRPLQKMPVPGTPVLQAYGDIQLQEGKPELTKESDIANKAPGDFIYLVRGVSPTQRKFKDTDIIAGSHVSNTKMLGQESDHESVAPDSTLTAKYVAQSKDEGVGDLIEFSSDLSKAKAFGSDSAFGFIHYIKIKRQYLTKGSSGEFGWIASQKAPYTIVFSEKKYSTKPDMDTMSHEGLMSALEEEQDAEFLHKYQKSPELLNSPEFQAEKARYVKLKMKNIAAKKADLTS
jgi:hypothetical protein